MWFPRVVHLFCLGEPESKGTMFRGASSTPHLHSLDSLCVTPVGLAKGFQKQPKEDVKMCKMMKLWGVNPVALGSPL